MGPERFLDQHGQAVAFNGVVRPHIGSLPNLHAVFSSQPQTMNQAIRTPSYQPQSIHTSSGFNVTCADATLSVPPNLMPLILTPNIPNSQSSQRRCNGSVLPYNQCNRCHLFHAASMGCPALASVTDIRLALDGIRTLSGGDSATTQQNRDILQMILKQRKINQLGRKGGSPAQPQPLQPPPQPPPPPRPQQQPQPKLGQLPQPHQPQQPPMVQLQQPQPQQSQHQHQQSQARLSVPDEESSESDSSSEDESGSGSSSVSESGSQDEDG